MEQRLDGHLDSYTAEMIPDADIDFIETYWGLMEENECLRRYFIESVKTAYTGSFQIDRDDLSRYNNKLGKIKFSFGVSLAGLLIAVFGGVFSDNPTALLIISITATALATGSTLCFTYKMNSAQPGKRSRAIREAKIEVANRINLKLALNRQRGISNSQITPITIVSINNNEDISQENEKLNNDYKKGSQTVTHADLKDDNIILQMGNTDNNNEKEEEERENEPLLDNNTEKQNYTKL